MTRDELLDEGFEKALDFEGTYMQKKACYQYGYADGAEPREKRIAELEAVNKRILDECHKLVDSLEKKQKEIAELKAQIEKMKCDLLELRNDSYDAGMYLRIDELIQKWEIKENDR